MTEKEIAEKAETIIEALTLLSMGKEPSMLSNSVFKKLGKHRNFVLIRNAYTSYLQNFDGKLETSDEIRKLFEFRLKITQLFEE